MFLVTEENILWVYDFQAKSGRQFLLPLTKSYLNIMCLHFYFLDPTLSLKSSKWSVHVKGNHGNKEELTPIRATINLNSKNLQLISWLPTCSTDNFWQAFCKLLWSPGVILLTSKSAPFIKYPDIGFLSIVFHIPCFFILILSKQIQITYSQFLASNWDPQKL